MKKLFFKYAFLITIIILGCKNGTNSGSDADFAAFGNVQACSYDGKPVTMNASMMSFAGGGSVVDAINEIMKFTGLPQNFQIVETEEVNNAAAVILQGADGTPVRVIAYNPKFMDYMNEATKNNSWAAISILAHEVGHHLCGHTIVPGGSQPPTELEADKFSGFVLYKMGSPLTDAEIAMQTLSPEEDGPTHPGKSKRLVAIEEGWKQACTQVSEECNGNIAANPSNSGNITVSSDETPTEISMDDINLDPSNTSAGNATPAKLPNPDDSTIPNKFNSFVNDELGVIQPEIKQRLNKMLYDFAKDKNVEVVLLVVKDLKGMNADDYANSMLRQLRIGKLELGNGACLVVAPNQNQIGVGVMPGLQFEIDEDRINGEIKSYLNDFMNYYLKNNNSGFADYVIDGAKRIIDLTKFYEWVIKYNDLNKMLDADKQESAEGTSPENSTTWLKLVRTKGTLVSKNGFKNIPSKYSNEFSIPHKGFEMEVKTDDGKLIRVYATQLAEKLMTAKLENGKKYSFVLRARTLGSDYPSLDLVSYDLVN